MTNTIALLGFSGAFGFLLILVLLAILVFEIAMFVDAWRNPNIPADRRMIWLIGMVLLHPVVAIFYYFTDRNKA